jgi:hypothetical protein
MADDDDTNSTPLDLLLNAISGSAGYAFAEGDGNHFAEGLEPQFDGEEGGEAADGADIQLLENGEDVPGEQHGEPGEGGGEVPEAGAAEDDQPPSPRAARIQRTLRDHFAAGRDAFSTVEVWHPKTGQKSYGKERR